MESLLVIRQLAAHPQFEPVGGTDLIDMQRVLERCEVVDAHLNIAGYTLAAAMGARSRQIRLRTSVLLAPLYDPVKLAEDAAVTQLVTGGRLVLGIGGGYRPAAGLL